MSNQPALLSSGTDANTVYYHAVLLNFRPFLVAEALVPNQQGFQPMWLREACRHAVNAAQDSLVFISSKFTSNEACRVCLSSSLAVVFPRLKFTSPD